MEEVPNELLGLAEPLRDEVSAGHRKERRVVGLRRHGLGQVGLARSRRTELERD